MDMSAFPILPLILKWKSSKNPSVLLPKAGVGSLLHHPHSGCTTNNPFTLKNKAVGTIASKLLEYFHCVCLCVGRTCKFAIAYGILIRMVIHTTISSKFIFATGSPCTLVIFLLGQLTLVQSTMPKAY